ncbi:MAG TPA: DUF2339 domain-containing protein [Blastocatellia bacterium]|nr:DUF2339 domain-containing protein [Blastocatellia bacterium]
MTSPETRGDQSMSWEAFDARISRLEKHLGLAPLDLSSDLRSPAADAARRVLPDEANGQSSELEASIGEFGLAWVGSIVFFLGVVFLITYTSSLGHKAISTTVGYLAAAGLFLAASLWKTRASHLSRILVSGSLLLLFYTTMRLHFFSPDPLVENSTVVLVLLLVVVGLQLYLAVHRDSETLATVGILLGMLAALLIDRTHIELPLVAILSAAAVYLGVSRGWWRLLNAGIVLAYTAHLSWLLNNPVAGNQVQAVSEHQYNLVYLFLYAGIFTLPLFLNKQVSFDDLSSLGLVFLNCLGLGALVFLVTLTHLQKDFPAISLGVCGMLMASSIAQFIRTNRQLGPAIYACFGFMALSIAIYGYAAIPDSFFWLSLQSLLVVSIALWFRSRILVVVNSLIYVGILVAYFALSPSWHPVNFSFALVALASARVMNWQKERLTLRTEMLRNVYLFIAFVLVFYATYRAVPAQYVTLSWTLTAVVYFLLSYLLRSNKYRLMAISGMLVTVVYLFLVDLASLDPRFRVAAFMFLGLMAVMISLYYTRTRKPLKESLKERE